MCLTGSGDELCGLISALFQAAAHHPPTVSLSLQALFTESSHGDQLLAFPPFSGAVACQPVYLSRLCLLKVPTEISSFLLPPSPVCSENPTLSAACSFSVPCLLFSFCFAYFLQGRGQSLQVAMLVYPRGSCENITCLCLPSRFEASIWVAWEPSCFLSVTWHGKALYRLVVQGVRVLILVGGFFLPNVAPVSQQNF
jgi:hypothetical protein